jgi:hypothetical protein
LLFFICPPPEVDPLADEIEAPGKFMGFIFLRSLPITLLILVFSFLLAIFIRIRYIISFFGQTSSIETK